MANMNDNSMFGGGLAHKRVRSTGPRCTRTRSRLAGSLTTTVALALTLSLSGCLDFTFPPNATADSGTREGAADRSGDVTIPAAGGASGMGGTTVSTRADAAEVPTDVPPNDVSPDRPVGGSGGSLGTGGHVGTGGKITTGPDAQSTGGATGLGGATGVGGATGTGGACTADASLLVNGATCATSAQCSSGFCLGSPGQCCQDCTSTCYAANQCSAGACVPASGTVAVAAGDALCGLKVDDSSNASAWSFQTNLQVGDQAMAGESTPLTVVSSEVAGLPWIRPSRLSKSATASPLVTFTLSAPADVYVGVDTRIAAPAWVSGWTDSGAAVAYYSSSTGTTAVQTLWKTRFAAGSVALGPLGCSSTTPCSMYLVVIKFAN